MIVFAIAWIVIAILSVIGFHAEAFIPMLIVLLASASIVSERFKRKKADQRLKFVAPFCLGLCCILFIMTGLPKDSYPMRSYLNDLEQVEKQAQKNPQKALKALKQLESDYSFHLSTEYTLRANIDYNANDLEGVNDALEDVARDENYYLLKAKILLAASKAERTYSFEDKTQDVRITLQKLFLEASENLPDWAYAKTMCGAYAYSLDRKLNVANYYLTEALTLDPKDSTAWYYLGVISYELSDWDFAETCFQQAKHNHPSSEVKTNANEYLDHMAKEG